MVGFWSLLEAFISRQRGYVWTGYGRIGMIDDYRMPIALWGLLSPFQTKSKVPSKAKW